MSIKEGFEIIEQISYIARVAGTEIMKFYTGSNTIDINMCIKPDQSPVTNADLFAHKVIVYLLHNLTPHIPIISEENTPSWDECKKWNSFWLIDPLDGTKEFLSHNGEFTVNIALIRYGEPVIGVIFVPVHNILYIADNYQTWKVNDHGEKFKISVKKSSSPIILMSRSHVVYDKIKLNHYLTNIKNYTIFYVGSSLKFCLIAEGLAQFYPRFSPTKIWDTAAGHVIVKSAGAIITDFNGQSLNYKYFNKSFTNPEFQVLLC